MGIPLMHLCTCFFTPFEKAEKLRNLEPIANETLTFWKERESISGIAKNRNRVWFTCKKMVCR